MWTTKKFGITPFNMNFSLNKIKGQCLRMTSSTPTRESVGDLITTVS